MTRATYFVVEIGLLSFVRLWNALKALCTHSLTPLFTPAHTHSLTHSLTRSLIDRDAGVHSDIRRSNGLHRPSQKYLDGGDDLLHRVDGGWV